MTCSFLEKSTHLHAQTQHSSINGFAALCPVNSEIKSVLVIKLLSIYSPIHNAQEDKNSTPNRFLIHNELYLQSDVCFHGFHSKCVSKLK